MAEDATTKATAQAQWTLPKLRITRDGEWFDGDVEITHPGVLRNLRGMLQCDAQGYFVQTRVRIPVDVEDAPLVVVRVERHGDRLRAILLDGTAAELDPATLRFGPGDVPHATIGAFEARLSRAAAFQLLALLETEDGHQVLRLGDRVHVLGPHR